MSTITLTGDYGATTYRVSGLASGTVIDATTASWTIDNVTADGDPANGYPFQVLTSPNVVINGGTLNGEVDQSLDWDTIYHVQSGNSAGLRLEGDPGVQVHNWRIDKPWDAIRTSSGTQNFLIDDVWVSNSRDDAVENDYNNSGTIRDTLFDGVFSGISTDGDVDGSARTIVMDGMLLRMKSYLYNGVVTHGSPFKTDSQNPEWTPNLDFHNSVVAIQNPAHVGQGRLAVAWQNLTPSSAGNVYLNLSDTPLPSSYPKPPSWAFTILEGQAARDYWNSARDTWVANHSGVPAANQAPTITSGSGADWLALNVNENGTAITTVTATDPEGQPIAYSLGGLDAAKFVINSNTGALSFVTAPDYEAPTDSGLNNSYELTVFATDSAGASDFQHYDVRVVDVNETPPQQSGTVDKRIVLGTDDAEQRSSSTDLSSSDLELVKDGSVVQTVGLRFQSLGIPQGATITGAYLQFTVDEIGSTATSLKVQGNDVGDAVTFTTAANAISGRVKTDAFATWTPDAWTTVNQVKNTPDLKAIVQEVVSRTDWANGNDMAFVVTGSGTRTANAFEDGANLAPLLHVDWTM